MNTTETSRTIAIKFYLKHHWDGGKVALGFGPDRIRTLVSMVTNSSHRVVMGKTVLSPFRLSLIRSFSYLRIMRTCMKSQRSSKYDQIRSPTVELAALERLVKSPYTHNGRNVVANLASSFLIGSSLLLQVTRTCIKAWMSLNIG